MCVRAVCLSRENWLVRDSFLSYYFAMLSGSGSIRHLGRTTDDRYIKNSMKDRKHG